MESRQETVKKIYLVLTENEAKWLKNVMQNPFNGQTVENEISTDRAMRIKFYEAIEKHHLGD